MVKTYGTDPGKGDYGSNLIYVTEKVFKEFHAKKLLGLKQIRVTHHPMEDCTKILVMATDGIDKVDAYYDNLTQQKVLYLTLK